MEDSTTKSTGSSTGYIPTELCQQCKGACCRAIPGIAFPTDFAAPLRKTVKQAVLTRRWAIDWYDGDPRSDLKIPFDDKDELGRCLYVRPATVDGDWPDDPSWGGRCVFLTKAGCELPFASRPTSCRMLEPIRLDFCDVHGHDKATCALAWIDHQDMLDQIIEEAQHESR